MIMDGVKITEFVRNLLKIIENITQINIEKYCNSNCDQTRKMKIVGKVDDTHYTVEYQGKKYKAFTRNEHNIGSTVYVTICCSNYNNLIIN